jgi:cytochrome c oxidase subunit 3
VPDLSATRPSTHAHQFDDAAQQRDAATFGMWVFLATEVLFFGAMFLGYTAYRLAYPAAFAAASRHTLIGFGGTNTAVLLISSATMAFAVRAARERRRTALALRLFATAALGALFLGIKGFEYAREIHEHLLPGSSFHFEPPYATHAEMFFYLYFLMTGVHALHVTIGVILITIFGFRAWRTGALARHDTAVDLLGLYWHFVDVVWVFLFPLIYLVERHS